jgi:hypothetical protein
MPTPRTSASSPLAASAAGLDAHAPPDRWAPPTVEVISLACEISAYAPDGDLPLV